MAVHSVAGLAPAYVSDVEECATCRLTNFRLAQREGGPVPLHKLSELCRRGADVRLEGEVLLPLPVWLHLGEEVVPPLWLEEEEDGPSGEAGPRPGADWYRLPLPQLEAFAAAPLGVGSAVDAFCPRTKKWFEAKVTREEKSRVTVHFKGWKAKYDETLERGSWRLAPLGVMTAVQRSVKAGRGVVVPRALVAPRAVCVGGLEDWCMDHSGPEPSLWLVTKDAWFRITGPLCEPHPDYRAQWEVGGVLFWLCAAVVRVLQRALTRRASVPYWRVLRSILPVLEEELPDFFGMLDRNVACAEVRASASGDAVSTGEEGGPGGADPTDEGAAPAVPVPSAKKASLSHLLGKRLRSEAGVSHLEKLLVKHTAFLMEQLRAVAHPAREDHDGAGAEPEMPEELKPSAEDTGSPTVSAAAATVVLQLANSAATPRSGTEATPAASPAANITSAANATDPRGEAEKGPAVSVAGTILPDNATLADTDFARTLVAKTAPHGAQLTPKTLSSASKASSPVVNALPEDAAHWREQLRIGHDPVPSRPPASHQCRQSATFISSGDAAPDKIRSLWDLEGKDFGKLLEVWLSLQQIVAPLAKDAASPEARHLASALPFVGGLDSPEALLKAVLTGGIAPVGLALVRAALEPRLLAADIQRQRGDAGDANTGSSARKNPSSAGGDARRSLGDALQAVLAPRSERNVWVRDGPRHARLEAVLPQAWPLVAELLLLSEMPEHEPVLHTKDWLSDATKLLEALRDALAKTPLPPPRLGSQAAEDAAGDQHELSFVGGAQLFQSTEGLRPHAVRALRANPSPALTREQRSAFMRHRGADRPPSRNVNEILADLEERAMMTADRDVDFLRRLRDEAHAAMEWRLVAWRAALTRAEADGGGDEDDEEDLFMDVQVSKPALREAVQSLEFLWATWDRIFRDLVMAHVEADAACMKAPPLQAVGASLSALGGLAQLVLEDAAVRDKLFSSPQKAGAKPLDVGESPTSVVDLSKVADVDAPPDAGPRLNARLAALGQDRDFSRYYKFEASRPEASRVFVEAADGSRWDVYDAGEDLVALHAWLEPGMRREGPLKASLSAMIEVPARDLRATFQSAAEVADVMEIEESICSSAAAPRARDGVHLCSEALRNCIAAARISGYGDAFDRKRAAFCETLTALAAAARADGRGTCEPLLAICDLALSLEDALVLQSTAVRAHSRCAWRAILRRCRTRLASAVAVEGTLEGYEVQALFASLIAAVEEMPGFVDAGRAHQLLQPLKLQDVCAVIPDKVAAMHAPVTRGAFCNRPFYIFWEGRAEADCVGRSLIGANVWGQSPRPAGGNGVTEGEGYSFALHSVRPSALLKGKSAVAPASRKRKRDGEVAVSSEAAIEDGDGSTPAAWADHGVFALCSLRAQGFDAPKVRVVAPVRHCVPSCVALWLLSELVDHDAAEPFLEVPDPEEHSAYATEVATPMSLSIIQETAQEGRYRSIGDIQRDLDLLLANCQIYCGSRFPSLVTMATTLVTEATSLLADVDLNIAALTAGLVGAAEAAVPAVPSPPSGPMPEVPCAATSPAPPAKHAFFSASQRELVKCAVRLDSRVPRYMVPRADLLPEITLGQWVRHKGNTDANGWVLGMKRRATSDQGGMRDELFEPAFDEEAECGSADIDCVWRQVAVLWAKPYLGRITLENSWDLSDGDEDEEMEVQAVNTPESAIAKPSAPPRDTDLDLGTSPNQEAREVFVIDD